MKKSFWRNIVVLLLIIIVPKNISAAPTFSYSITDLGTVGVYDINDSGQVIGSEGLWEQSTGWTSLGFTPSTINDNGDMLCDGHYFWLGDQIIDLGTEHTIIDLNNNGQVLGSRDLGDGSYCASIWEPNTGWRDVYSYSEPWPGVPAQDDPIDINDRGEILLGSNDLGEARIWRESEGVVSIGVGYLCYTSALNDLSHATGRGIVGEPSIYGPMLYIDGTETPLYPGNLHDGWGHAINNVDQILVSTIFEPDQSNDYLWEDGNLRCLNELMSSDTGWVLSGAADLNDVGQIIGWGSYNGEDHSYLLTPEWDALVTTNYNYFLDLTLGKSLEFYYWFYTEADPGSYQPGFNYDVLALQETGEWLFLGQVGSYYSSNEWQYFTLNVPEELQGLATQIRFHLSDFDPATEPIVYLRDIHSPSPAPVPEPSSMLLLGFGIIGLAGLSKKIRKS